MLRSDRIKLVHASQPFIPRNYFNILPDISSHSHGTEKKIICKAY